ncbi:MAG TPA: GNAT family N-acetyltransferase [Acidimicrobiales bacterium]|jgi:predicted GNAT family acetyltransferase|nr:GNAT family N-acetyltransferase [Acidimicrobiales bacterium]
MTDELRRNDEAGQYELTDADGKVLALTQFEVDGDRVVMPHTESDPAYKGRGLAGRVVAFALDDIRASGRKVEAKCEYVQNYIERHDQYHDLVAH